jgi:glycosyltransferase involved in cell wall biosynthesis
MDGQLRYPLFVKNLALTYLRRWDQRWHKRLWKRPQSAVSANTPTSSRLLASSHGWPTSKDWIAGDVKFRDEQQRPAEVGVLWPAIDPSAWPVEVSEKERNAWDAFAHKPASPYLLTIGRAGFMKGSKEAVQVAAAASLPLVHVGGGEVEEMQHQAKKLNAELLVMPRIDEMEIVALMRNAHALIATARTEGFGLTPMEAAMVGTPALVVSDCGFTHTVTDGFNGRRLPWPNTQEGLEQWVMAVEQAGEEKNRMAWSEAGRERILQRFTANHQAEGLARSLAAMGVKVETTELEMLPGLDPA